MGTITDKDSGNIYKILIRGNVNQGCVIRQDSPGLMIMSPFQWSRESRWRRPPELVNRMSSSTGGRIRDTYRYSGAKKYLVSHQLCIFLSGRTCTIGGWLNTFFCPTVPHCEGVQWKHLAEVKWNISFRRLEQALLRAQTGPCMVVVSPLTIMLLMPFWFPWQQIHKIWTGFPKSVVALRSSFVHLVSMELRRS